MSCFFWIICYYFAILLVIFFSNQHLFRGWISITKPTRPPNQNSGFGESGGCTLGQYQEIPASVLKWHKLKNCKPCTAGTYQSENSINLLGAHGGVIRSTNALKTQDYLNRCWNCPAGFTSGGEASECVECALHTFAEDLGSSSCTDCPIGWSGGAAPYSSCTKCIVSNFLFVFVAVKSFPLLLLFRCNLFQLIYFLFTHISPLFTFCYRLGGTVQ